MNKKHSPEWYIAGTHWLTSMITAAIIGSIVIFLLAIITQNIIALAIGALIIYPLSMWLAVIYSARFINKRYEIANPNHIITLSTLFLVIVAGGYRLFVTISNPISTISLANILGFLIMFVIFYFASKKYVVKNIA